LNTRKLGKTTFVQISSTTSRIRSKQEADIGTSQLTIQEQIKTAFESAPSLGGALQGIRRITHGGKGRRTSLFPSRKNGAALALESRLELAHAVQLERDSTIQQYRAQAIQIALPNGFDAIPDFIVQTTDGNFEVHEVKPSIKHLSIAELTRFQMIEEILDSIRIRFRLIDHNTLPSETAVCHLLQIYARGHIDNFTPLQVQMARRLLIKTIPKHLQDAHATLINAGLPSLLAEHLIFHKAIELPTHTGLIPW
jgi:hypothetical protein